MKTILQLILTASCSLMSGMSGSLLSSFYPTEALRVGISISITGYVFGCRLSVLSYYQYCAVTPPPAGMSG